MNRTDAENFARYLLDSAKFLTSAGEQMREAAVLIKRLCDAGVFPQAGVDETRGNQSTQDRASVSGGTGITEAGMAATGLSGAFQNFKDKQLAVPAYQQLSMSEINLLINAKWNTMTDMERAAYDGEDKVSDKPSAKRPRL